MEINNEFNTALELVYKAANEETKKVLETNFPQLRESGDERIRKELISFVNKYYGEETKKEVLAYLEKQKEYKSLPLDLSVEDVETIKTALRVSGLEFTSNQKVYDKLEKLSGSAYYLSTVGHSELYPDGRVERHTIGYLEKQKEQKPTNSEKPKEWSEDDEWKINELLKYLEEKGDYRSTWYSWLKSLLERFNLQPKQEWSEDDEQYLLVCKNALKKYQRSDHWDANIISKWLEEKIKSLRPQPHWKPSEEQMNRLGSIIVDLRKDFCYDVANFLESLCNGLKKL